MSTNRSSPTPARSFTSIGNDRIVYGMLKRGRPDESPNWSGAAEGALNYAQEIVEAQGDKPWQLWAASAIVYALFDVANAIRSVKAE